MPRRNENFFTLLIALPWWFSFIVATTAYFLVAVILPEISKTDQFFTSFTASLAPYAGYIAGFFLIPIPFSLLKARTKRRTLDRQTSIQSIRALDWHTFEELIGEIYRRQGFAVEENEFAGPDGGIDLLLRKGGDLTLVQCKQWRSKSVGVPIIREMFGILSASEARNVIVITSGHFTQEAIKFAKGKPINLIDGDALFPLLKEVQESDFKQSNNDSFDNSVENPRVEPTVAAVQIEQNRCPKCGSDMVLRTAKKGQNSGKQFYGCSGYPKCRFTASHDM